MVMGRVLFWGKCIINLQSCISTEIKGTFLFQMRFSTVKYFESINFQTISVSCNKLAILWHCKKWPLSNGCTYIITIYCGICITIHHHSHWVIDCVKLQILLCLSSYTESKLLNESIQPDFCQLTNHNHRPMIFSKQSNA